MDAVDQDPLLLLRQSIASGSSIIPTTSPDDTSSSSAPEANLAQATHLQFTHPRRVSIPIDAPTRFISNDSPVDLRSIYFAWLNREVAIPEYNASATKLNDELAGASTVHKFAFVERLDLITWLEGASEESEYIKPLAGDKDSSAVAAAASAALKGSAAPTSAQAKSGRGTLDPRLAQIYNGERPMGDRNTVLRGIKPTDFSHVRKLAATIMTKKPLPSSSSTAPAPSQSLALNPKHAQRRPDPIILLSPSASSLLRMSNVKSFLEGGRYVPPDSSSTATMLHITRVMKDIDPSRPMRFILVEGPEQFKPEYWNRVVAVFTTGQSWQFKNYKWSSATELFKHVLGIYVGWRGDQPPDAIKSFGKRIVTSQVDKWSGSDASRWRDREVVEGVWKAIEGNMRAKGWKRDAAPVAI
ncbi:CDC73-domain-containing protein [Coniochaeta ligniaria NRRL 30616]|uniref:CDC73-domain-containing protein n=1 Tax=Coniochaeta ligniaria NRRL 30616 TaxID=1408157 RepID=A0A1J7IXZ4_9PEZI|nr:CDC73-domain-containing protein [Coniochaeta ligniaria NRRL 30616]